MDTSIVHLWGRQSPVAQRPKGARNFPVGLAPIPNAVGNPLRGATRAPQYKNQPDGSVLEPQSLRVIGRPSLRIYQSGDGGAVIELKRRVSNMERLTDEDMSFVTDYGRDVLAALVALSRGPLTYKDLRRLKHPYGYEESWLKGNKTMKGRVVPRNAGKGKSLGHAAGVRGSVPTLTVINRHTGLFSRSWSWEWQRDRDGFTIRFSNDAPYAWNLAHGTFRMQPHGPWTHAPQGRLSQLDASLRRSIALARHREKAADLMANTVATVNKRNAEGVVSGVVNLLV